MILSGHKLSLQNAVNKAFKALGRVFEVPTAAAYCQARQKVQAEVFTELNRRMIADFYEFYGADGEVDSWHGHRLLGSDGTYLTLPDSAELRAAFSVHCNQHQTEPEGTVQALAMVLHDLQNGLGLRGALGPSHAAEKDLLLGPLWEELKAGDVLVLDRKSADYSIIAQAAKTGVEVIIRCPRQSFKAVMELFASRERESFVTLSVTQTTATREYVEKHDLPREVAVRLLKFKLPTGEDEVLLTTLTDQKQYRRKEFYEVYGWRWRDETYLDRLKNIFEVERFGGQSVESVKQDFYAVIFLTTLESVVSRETEQQMQEMAEEREVKYPPQINHAVSYVALSQEVVSLLGNREKSAEEVLKELKHLFRQTPTRIRAGRKSERKKPRHAVKLKYQQHRKRVIA